MCKHLEFLIKIKDVNKILIRLPENFVKIRGDSNL